MAYVRKLKGPPLALYLKLVCFFFFILGQFLVILPMLSCLTNHDALALRFLNKKKNDHLCIDV